MTIELAYAERDITPLPGEELAGYGFHINRRADSTLDPLFCRVCFFRDGARAAALVQLDLIGLQADHVEELRERLGRAYGLPPEAILFHCTHTHTAPASLTIFGPGALTPAWRGILTKHIVETVAEARKEWRPVGCARWFYQKFSGIAFNRDDPDGPVDTRICGLFLEPCGAAPVVLVNYACHPVARDVLRAYSADYPGAVARCLAASGIRCVFLTAPCGDLDPLVNKALCAGRSADVLQIYGQRIAGAVEKGIASGEEIALDELRFALRRVDLAVDPPDRKECEKVITQAKADLQEDPTNGLALSVLNGSRHWIEMLDSSRYGNNQPVEVQALGLGRLVIGGIGAELFSELAELIRKRAGIKRLVLAGTCNALVSYIATRRSVERGSYAYESARFYGCFPQCVGAGERFAGEAADFLADAMN